MYNQQALPVSAEQVQGPILSGLPWQVPFYPNVQIPEHLQPYAPGALGMLLLELQNNLNKNPLRMFLFNLASQDNYQNQAFNELFLTVLEYAEFLMASNPHTSPEAAVRQAVSEVCSMVASVNVYKYPGLQSYVTDPNVKRDIDGWVAKFQEVAANIEAYQRQVSAPYGGYGQYGQQPVQQGWGSYGNVGGYAQQPYYGGHGAQGYGYQATALRPSAADMAVRGDVSSRSAVHQSRPGFGLGGGFSRSQHQQGPLPSEKRFGKTLKPSSSVREEEPNSFTTGPGLRPSFGFAGGRREEVTQPTTQPQQAFGGMWSKNIPDKEETPMNTSAKPDSHGEIRRPDGSVLRPAHTSGWVKTPNPEQPYTPAYDPTKEILYHRKAPDGTVTEVLMEVNDDNEYLLYELRPTFQNKVNIERRNDPKKVNWDLVGEMKTSEEVELEREEYEMNMDDVEEGENDIPEYEEPALVVPMMAVSSMEEASLGGALNLLNALDEVPENVPIEYFFYKATPFIVADSDVDPKEEISKLENCKTIVDLAESMSEMIDKIPDKVWYHIHDKLTEHVNEVLKVNLQLPVSIDSIVDDAKDLIDVVRENHGDAYVKALNNSTGYIVKTNAKVLTDNMLKDYLKKLDFPIADPSVVDNIVVLGELTGVTEVPWMASDLPIVISSNASAVLESRFPNLHAAIDKIFKRARHVKEGNFRAHYIVTRDNVKIKLYEGFIGRGFYLIGKA